MFTINNFAFDSIKKLDELNLYNCLDIRSYKKNRKVIIEKLENTFNVYEDGYEKREFLNISKEELKKLLRTIEKIEFPRSNKLRVYVLETKDQSTCRANYRDESISEDEKEKLSIFIETSYSSYEAIKSLIESSNDLIIEVNFAQNVTIKSKVSTETYLTLKNYLKDRQDTNIFAY
ncbi:TPA: hypothetical protein I9010_001476 [Clostridium perfringens]|nr:hypothetical protein [Clostridium perfringens]MDK0956959.1 hypothetical protein [Clostridium perfringens]HAT4211912.1 hypothetical protein [Clostridium perfringens]